MDFINSNKEYDLVTMGEVMLRLDPGEGRIRTARNFRAWEGGGEYNVGRAERGFGFSCFGNSQRSYYKASRK